MPSCVLMRHAEPDWRRVVDLGWHGPAVDLAPLSERGVVQAHDAASALRGSDASVVISSPMPRALHTASIVALGLGIPLAVEFDLREWQPDVGLAWRGIADVRRAYDEMVAAAPDADPQGDLAWEPLSTVRRRALASLHRHVGSHDRALVVCHEVVIFALTGHSKTAHCGRHRIELD